MKFNIFKYDTAAIIIGLFLLYITFSFYFEGYLNFEGRYLLGVMLSITYILGSLIFIDGVCLLRERYKSHKIYINKLRILNRE